ncbi:MAG: endolytic transglycosylase MltG [Candidatus Niyogibacteria bacterium]|nr:endolytic transglycosylase MltG [Candidatus Niyogibacteria bacterium]
MQMTDESARKWALAVGAGLLLLAIISYFLFSYSPEFPAGRVVRVERGMHLDAVARQFTDRHVIRYPALFKFVAWLTTGDESVKAGEYYFERPLGVAGVWYRLTRGRYGIESFRVTIPEGWTVRQIGAEFEKRGLFSQKEWEASAATYEGYLFPDTYFFLPDTTPETAASAMLDNFNKKVSDTLRAEIARQRKTLQDVVIMASLIEKEANGGSTDAPVIAGILWKRLAENIGLQVDAALTYVTGRPSLQLRQSDLSLDSRYNTYKYRGLPPTPISNPGLDAIMAAVYPQKSLYLFYLHGSDGKARYAITFEEHILNKEKYLR